MIKILNGRIRSASELKMEWDQVGLWRHFRKIKMCLRASKA